ncbi:hypothetical protein VTO73DRAFT_10528 [Trametes versicolor]
MMTTTTTATLRLRPDDDLYDSFVHYHSTHPPAPAPLHRIVGIHSPLLPRRGRSSIHGSYALGIAPTRRIVLIVIMSTYHCTPRRAIFDTNSCNASCYPWLLGSASASALIMIHDSVNAEQ